jgi:hypothetical protein
VVAASLSDLRGPVSGMVTIDRWLDWSGDSTYGLDDSGDLQLMYQNAPFPELATPPQALAG